MKNNARTRTTASGPAAPLPAAPLPAAGYLRKREAASYMSVSTRTISDWMRRGILAYSKPCRKVTLFSIRDLERAMDRFRVEAGS
jgi:excisionase family DNA binding protein